MTHSHNVVQLANHEHTFAPPRGLVVARTRTPIGQHNIIFLLHSSYLYPLDLPPAMPDSMGAGRRHPHKKAAAIMYAAPFLTVYVYATRSGRGNRAFTARHIRTVESLRAARRRDDRRNRRGN